MRSPRGAHGERPEAWWNWRESNPRPTRPSKVFYERSPQFLVERGLRTPFSLNLRACVIPQDRHGVLGRWEPSIE